MTDVKNHNYTILTVWDKKKKAWSFEVAISGTSKRLPFSTFTSATQWITNHQAENSQCTTSEKVDGVYIANWLNRLEDEISCIASIRHRLEERAEAADCLQQEALAQEYRNLASSLYSAFVELNKLSDELEIRYAK